MLYGLAQSLSLNCILEVHLTGLAFPRSISALVKGRFTDRSRKGSDFVYGLKVESN